MMSTKLSPRERAALASQSMSAATVAQNKSADVAPRPSSIAIGLGMAGQSGRVKELEAQLNAVRSEVNTWNGSLPTKKIPPGCIRPSKWANRHSDGFDSKEFKSLKDEIESQGGNVQPIKVRPIPGSEPAEYEIVFGHRRHRACFELGIEVLAIIESVDDVTLFAEMDRENRQRENLRPYEQGLMYKRAMDEGLFPSQRKAAETLGVPLSNFSTSISIASIPEKVLAAFESPLDIQYRWASDMNAALEKDPDLVIARAMEISNERSTGTTISSQEAFRRLCGLQQGPDEKGVHVVKHAGKAAFKVSVSKNKVGIELPTLTKAALSKLEKAILELLKAEGVLR